MYKKFFSVFCFSLIIATDCLGVLMDDFDVECEGESIKFSCHSEAQLDSNDRVEISKLLYKSFSDDYIEGRTYFKQLPQYRILARSQNIVVGHLAVDHRVVFADGNPLEIFGVVDLCVQEKYRRRKIGENLLSGMLSIARRSNVEVILAFADDDRLYSRIGFKRENAICRFLAIEVEEDYLRSHSVIEREEPSLMIISPKPIKKIDMLGHIF